jgi:branched-chain amino acid transport system ATP-binding protein
MTSAITVEGLHKSYGKIEVLRNVSFSVEERETFAVIGPNGAGKSTLFRVVTGEVAAEQGRVVYRGADVTSLSAAQRINIGFGRTFQVARIFPEFTVRENIIVAIEARERRNRDRSSHRFDFRPSAAAQEEAAQIAETLELSRRLCTGARFLAHGDKKRLEIAIALALEPRLLMMDEPTAGMSPADRRATIDLLSRLRRERPLTIVIIEHDMDVVFGLAGRVMVLNYGQIIAMGSVAEVRADNAVREVYLGKEMSVA